MTRLATTIERTDRQTGEPTGGSWWKGMILALLLAGILPGPMPSARAQETVADLVNQIQRIDQDLQALQQQVYGGKTPASAVPRSGAPGGKATPYMAQAENRFGEINQQLRALTGQVETLEYQLRQMQEQLENLVGDVDFRLRELESRMDGAGPSGGLDPERPFDTGAYAPESYGPVGEPAAESLEPKPLYDLAMQRLRKNADYAGAEQLFDLFLERYPNHALAGNVVYWQGETFYARRDFNKAVITFAQGVRNYRNGPKMTDSLLKLGMSLAAANRRREACTTLQLLLTAHGGAAPRLLRRARKVQADLICG